MIPVELQSRANYIFREMGGIEEVSRLISEEDIIDMCLYEGTIVVLQRDDIAATYNAVEAEYNSDYSDGYNTGNISSLEVVEQSTQNTAPKEVYDLEMWGYDPDTHYYVLDGEYNELYKNRATRRRVNGIVSSYFGYSLADLEFLLSQRHGTLFHILFHTPTTPVVIRVIINSRPNPQHYSEYLVELKQALKQRKVRVWNEMQIETTAINTFTRLHLLEGDIRDNYSTHAIANNYLAQSITYPTNSPIYIRTEKNLWLCLREYFPVENDLTKDLLFLNVQLAVGVVEGLGLVEVDNITSKDAKSTDLLYVKAADVEGIEEELRLQINGRGQVEGILHTRYKNLIVASVEGEGSEHLVLTPDKAFFLGIANKSRQSVIRSSYPLGRSLTTGMKPKGRFNIRAAASY